MTRIPGLFFWSLAAVAHAAPIASSVWDAQPVRFEMNRGQAAAEALFVSRGSGYSVLLERTGHTLILEDRLRHIAAAVRTRAIGVNSKAKLEAAEPLSTSSNYFIGNRTRWLTGVPNYGSVRYHELYRGIDLIFHGSAGRLEYDFSIAPGADPNAIRLGVEGAGHIEVGPEGDLLLTTPAGQVRWKSPAAFQLANGKRKSIDARFKVSGNRVRVDVGSYDHTKPLIIDPTLVFASYLGRSQNESARGIGEDGAGNVYIAGYSTSPDLVVSATALQPAYKGGTTDFLTGDAFVAKFSPTGALVYLTYLGGKANDLATCLAVDAAGNAYVGGNSSSTDFPVTAGAAQTKMAGGGGNDLYRLGDAFIAKIGPAGDKLLYATFLGGSRDDYAGNIALDSSGNVYLVGSTLSHDFPVTTGAYQTTYKGEGGEPAAPKYGFAPFLAGDAYVAKLSADGSTFLFVTYFGGSLDDLAQAIAVDAGGNLYIGGNTISRDFPTTPSAYQRTYAGSEADQGPYINPFYSLGDGFVAKFDPTGKLIFSTLFGGTGDDSITAIAVDAGGNIAATGATTTRNFIATAGAFQRNYKGPTSYASINIDQIIGDAFLLKFNSSGSSVLVFTYLGGQGDDGGTAIALDAAGNFVLAGFTNSPDFPVTADAAQSKFGGTQDQKQPLGDAFLAKVSADGTQLLYSTYLGGNDDDVALGLALDSTGNVSITGATVSPDFPTTPGAFQRSFGGQSLNGAPHGDSFVARYTGFAAISNLPTITPQGVVEASDYGESHTLAPAAWVEIYGNNLDTTAGRLWNTSDFTNGGTQGPTTLDGVQVLVNNVPVVISAASPTQVNVQMPDGIAAAGTATLVVKNANGTSAPYTINTALRSPGLYAPSAFRSGNRQYVGAILPDGTFVGAPGLAPGYKFQPAL
ncbi:MAG: SBBP repeat-containing protein, partial [Acidobacteriia bacterium]|nr:SBBP repeat-containing protein [Terriglobia bacterium]